MRGRVPTTLLDPARKRNTVTTGLAYISVVLLLGVAAPGCRRVAPDPPSAAAATAPVRPREDRPSRRIVDHFWTRAEIDSGRHLSAMDRIAGTGAFDLVLISERHPHTGVDFTDRALHASIAAAVRRAHDLGLEIAAHSYFSPFTRHPVPGGERLGIVRFLNGHLDAEGRADVVIEPIRPFFRDVHTVLGSRLFDVHVFTPAAGSDYEPGTLARAGEGIAATPAADGAVALRIHRPADAGRGFLASILTEYNYPDLLSPVLPDLIRRTLAAWAGLGLDGAALDEFGFFPLDEGQTRWRPEGFAYFTERGGQVYAARFGSSLRDDLPHHVLSPAGSLGVRFAALSRYREHCRAMVTGIERVFYDAARSTLRPGAFIGVHATGQNTRTVADVLYTAGNWWDVPRPEGQSDEDTPVPVRLGLAARWGAPFLHMYYAHDVPSFAAEFDRTVRHGGRLVYHAWNDVFGYGLPLEDARLLPAVSRLARAETLLDPLDLGLPEPDLLLLQGYHGCTNPGRPIYERSLIGSFETAGALTDRGIVAFMAPTYELADGDMRVEDGALVYGSQRFRKVLWYEPELAEPEVLAALAAFLSGGGRLAVLGVPSMTSRGELWPPEAHRRLKGARAATLDDALRILGPFPEHPRDGAAYPGGAAIFTDGAALLAGKSVTARVRLGDVEVESEHGGLLALRPSAEGLLFAGAGLRRLIAGGEVLFEDPAPCDVTRIREVGGHVTTVQTPGPVLRGIAIHDLVATSLGSGRWRLTGRLSGPIPAGGVAVEVVGAAKGSGAPVILAKDGPFEVGAAGTTAAAAAVTASFRERRSARPPARVTAVLSLSPEP